MGLFEWFKRNQPPSVPPLSSSHNGLEAETKENGNAILSDTGGDRTIPREIFIEEKHPDEHSGTFNNSRTGIDAIYAFLQRDYEQKGYNDALRNEDQGYKQSNIQSIKRELLIMIDREALFLEKSRKDLECEIDLRKNAGFYELARRLETTKEKVLADIAKLNDIKQHVESNSGLFENVLLSYERGFNRGLVAISLSRFR